MSSELKNKFEEYAQHCLESARQEAMSDTSVSPTSRDRKLSLPADHRGAAARQSSKIRELGDALVLEGFLTLDEQADLLGLCRSTTWTILRGRHKSSGLTANIINRMLTAPRLPPLVRAKILESAEEKAAGLYGHGNKQRHTFSARLFLMQSSQRRSG